MSGDKPKQFDIVAETRRVRSDEEKRAIVAEALIGYRNASAVARRHAIKPSLLFRWKKQFSDSSAVARGSAASFVPVTVALPPPQTKTSGYSSGSQSMIEIEVCGGRKLRVGTGIDIELLKRIVVALETS